MSLSEMIIDWYSAKQIVLNWVWFKKKYKAIRIFQTLFIRNCDLPSKIVKRTPSLSLLIQQLWTHRYQISYTYNARLPHAKKTRPTWHQANSLINMAACVWYRRSMRFLYIHMHSIAKCTLFFGCTHECALKFRCESECASVNLKSFAIFCRE